MLKIGIKLMTKLGKELFSVQSLTMDQWAERRQKEKIRAVEVYFIQKLFGLHKDTQDKD
jgi:hypothetical protein